mmetsp:Transcript_74022/g.117232  ORF Transcript_74022/g.117232 Transcript_74022/m.117232 type:complete len:375 (+) Transcript_74022:2-1126(+)
MHWALTQFQGTSEIVPGASTGERCYAVMTVLASLLILSSFVSSLTNMMMQLQSLHSVRNFQQRAVRGYLNYHKISTELSTRVKKFVEWKQKLQKHNEYNEEVLKILPPQLLMDVQNETRSPTLCKHNFFEIFTRIYPRLTRKVCHVALQHLSPAPEEIIFSHQETCYYMYFVESGELVYTVVQRQDAAVVSLGKHHAVSGSYLAEPGLWMHWQHKGDLVVDKFASLLAVCPNKFADLVSSHPPAHVSCILYARRYIGGMMHFGWSVTDMAKPENLITKDDDDFILGQPNKWCLLLDSAVRQNQENQDQDPRASYNRSGTDRSLGSSPFRDSMYSAFKNGSRPVRPILSKESERSVQVFNSVSVDCASGYASDSR